MSRISASWAIVKKVNTDNMKTVTYQNIEFEEYLNPDEIAEAVHRVAERINHDYHNRRPLFLCVLRGAFIYMADLMRQLTIPTEVCFVRLHSYDGMKSTGKIRQLTGLTESVEDRDVIIVEDIVDTGLTVHWLKKHLMEQGAHSVAVTSFLYKPDALLHEDARPDYPACEIPTKFVIGYGLDIDELARNLPSVYAKKE